MEGCQPPADSDGSGKYFDENGNFTCGFCHMFRLKRLALGVSYRELARIFDVSWSAIRKWEAGLTTHCNLQSRHCILAFMEGKYDHEIREIMWQGNALSNLRDFPPDIQEAICRASNAYILCYGNRSLCLEMTNILEQTVHRVRSTLNERQAKSQQEERLI